MKSLNRITAFAVGVSLCAGMLVSIPGFAAKEEISYPELKTASPFSRAIQTVTGFTPVTGWVANRILRKELSQHVEGKLHSKLKLFSGSDLLGRKARSIRIEGENVLVDDYIPLTEFHFENKSEMPLYLSKGNRPILLRPVHFKVSAVMTEEDLNRMLVSEKGQKKLTGMKVSIPPFGPQYFDLMNPSIKLDEEKVWIESLMNTHGAPPENALPIKVSGKLTAEKSKLALSDLDLQIEGLRDTEEIEQLIENYFSELVDLNHLKVERHRVKVKIEKSELVDHRLNLQATVIVEPDKKALKKVLAQK